jgi:hypothetical protein
VSRALKIPSSLQAGQGSKEEKKRRKSNAITPNKTAR